MVLNDVNNGIVADIDRMANEYSQDLLLLTGKQVSNEQVEQSHLFNLLNLPTTIPHCRLLNWPRDLLISSLMYGSVICWSLLVDVNLSCYGTAPSHGAGGGMMIQQDS